MRLNINLCYKLIFILSTFFNANPRPDALMKEQLVEMTGLSPRVIRVWFQNKRCKHNKKTNALKIQMEQEKVRKWSIQLILQIFILQLDQEMKQIGYGRMHGVPLVATSPVRNDESPINLHGFEVTSFQPPWKMISDLAMHADSKNNGMHQMHSPAYQDIVNQVRSWLKSCTLSLLTWLIFMTAHNRNLHDCTSFFLLFLVCFWFWFFFSSPSALPTWCFFSW